MQMNISQQPVNLSPQAADINRALGKSAGAQETGFKDAMVQALQATSSLQKESGRLSREFQLEKSTASLEETMLAGVKSNVAFQATLQVRNRLIQAYTDVMNMQV